MFKNKSNTITVWFWYVIMLQFSVINLDYNERRKLISTKHKLRKTTRRSL